MAKDDGGPAFPFPVLHGSDAPKGMTLRDYFAAKAMQGIVSAYGDPAGLSERIADQAYWIADAMIAERAK